MARYKYLNYLQKSDHEAYDVLWSPGATCINSGIYRCEGCGDAYDIKHVESLNKLTNANMA